MYKTRLGEVTQKIDFFEHQHKHMMKTSLESILHKQFNGMSLAFQFTIVQDMRLFEFSSHTLHNAIYDITRSNSLAGHRQPRCTSLFQSSGLRMHQLKHSCSSKSLSTGHLILRAPAGRESLDLADLRILPCDTSTTVPSHQMNTCACVVHVQMWRMCACAHVCMCGPGKSEQSPASSCPALLLQQDANTAIGSQPAARAWLDDPTVEDA